MTRQGGTRENLLRGIPRVIKVEMDNKNNMNH